MGLFNSIQQAIKTAVESNTAMTRAMASGPEKVKVMTDTVVNATGKLTEAGSAIGAAIGAPDIDGVGRNWGEASNDWDDCIDQTIRKQVLINYGYPTDRELTSAEKAQYEKNVKAEKEKFDAQLRQDIGENLFEFGSAVKNGGAEATQAIGQYISIRDIYSTPTSTGNLEDLSNKIQNTVQTTIDATQKMASAGQRVFKWLMHNNGSHSHSESVILNNIQNIGISRLGMGATAVAGAAVGINAMVSAFKSNGITGAVSAGVGAYNSVRGQWDKAQAQREKFFTDKEKLETAQADGRHPFWADGKNNLISPEEETKKVPDNSDTPSDTSITEEPSDDDNNRGGAEYVSEVTFLLNGKKAGGNSECVVGETEYFLSNYHLSQRMLSPMTLSFTMIKKDVVEENEKDVKYDVCKQIIGLDVEMTIKTKYSDEPSAEASGFSFKGLITGVSASRGTGGTPSIYVTASSYDYLLDGAPNCRSFENKTLKEIVESVTGSIKGLKVKISPRLKMQIPYIVQYNQTDYDFLSSLARRFGEWMYHSGTYFIFGEIVPPSDNVVTMRYPGGNVFIHGVDLRLRDLNIVHVSSDLYNYGEKGIVKQTDEAAAERKTHELNDATFERVRSLYSHQKIYYPHIGGAFDTGKEEGTNELMLNSIKVESRGKRAQMFISNGSSKVAKLFLGQQFQIEDGVENNSTDKEDINQHPLMVLSVTHDFNLDQSYENTFEAIPPSCDYPPYTTADIFSKAFPQRATVVDNQDPMGLGRVRVQFPWQKIQESDDEPMWTPWIRVSQSYGGFSKGTQFISEVGEEVMVGFEMDNVERPYVIGALFNGTENPDEDWKAKVETGTANNIKAIRTRNGHTIQFSDEGDGGDIQIYDYEKNNYLIQLSTDGKYIRIEAKGDIHIVAGNDIHMRAAKNIAIQAGESISVESGRDTDISADANMSISAGDNMQQQATDIYVKAADSISEEAGNTYVTKTTTLQEKASSKVSIDGGGLVEITASSVKIRE